MNPKKKLHKKAHRQQPAGRAKTVHKIQFLSENAQNYEAKTMKDSTKKAQMKRFFECLKERPKTTAMAAAETGIMRANLTRYIATFEKRGIVTTVEKKKCEYTGHSAKYYSTDEAYFPKETQPELFPKKTQSRVYQI